MPAVRGQSRRRDFRKEILRWRYFPVHKTVAQVQLFLWCIMLLRLKERAVKVAVPEHQEERRGASDLRKILFGAASPVSRARQLGEGRVVASAAPAPGPC